MSLSTTSIKNPVFAWMLMFGLIIFGWISFTRMGISNLPDADFPMLTVTVNYEGASPEVMEMTVADVLEDAVMTVSGIRSTSSASRYGMTTLSIEFDLNKNIDIALQEVQTKITQAQRMLPKTIDPPIIMKMNPEDQPVLFLSLSSTKHNFRQLLKYTRDVLKDKFTTVPGVGNVFMGGYIDPNLRIWIHNDKLRKYELTASDILRTIENEHVELPAGQIASARREVDVRTMGEARSLEDFADIVISQRGGTPNYNPIRLKEVATIEDGLAEVRRGARANGEVALGLGIIKQRGANAVEMAKAVKKQMATLSKSLPDGMSLRMNFDSTKFIEESVGELNFTLILSALLTGLVCWLFLGSWSSTVNVLFAIPTSIIGAFMIMHFMGFTLNTFTLLGLSLAIGIVVDDAIMVLENIVRHHELGAEKIQAAHKGSREITFAAIAATIAIVAIFLPVAFMRGVIGKFFFQFGVTMTATVGLSLLEALTLTPMRCSQFLASGERSTRLGHFMDQLFNRSSQAYRRALEICLRNRWKVVGTSILFSLASCASIKWINKEFTPAQDQSMMMVKLETPIDSSLQYTDTKFREVEKYMAGRKEVLRYFSIIGGMVGGEVNGGNMFITLVPPKERKFSQQQLMDLFRDDLSKIPDLKVFMQDLSMRGFSASRGFPVEFSIRGRDWQKLSSSSARIMDEMKASGFFQDIDTDYKLGKPELRIFPNRIEAARRGVSIRTISETINALVGGTVRGQFQDEGRRYDIRIRMDVPEGVDRVKEVNSLFVRNNRGELVRLSDVVTTQEVPSLQQINRYDRERAVSVFANVARGKSQQAAIELAEKIATKILPQDYRLVLSGSAQTMKESFSDLLMAMLLGILVAYMVLASQFNSFIDPVTVLMALPFSVSGAFMALFLTRQSLNIFSFIGLILLMGIVKKNSILLVDFTNNKRDEGVHNIHEALLTACPIRLRPILMTSFATIAAAIPPALAIGPGAETRVPMSIAVIGGVLVSTLLTLFVVPCVYSLFSRVEKRKTIVLVD